VPKKLGKNYCPIFFQASSKKVLSNFLSIMIGSGPNFLSRSEISFNLLKFFLKLSGSIEIPKLPKTFQTSWENFHQEFLQSTPKQNWAEWKLFLVSFPTLPKTFCVVWKPFQCEWFNIVTPPYYLIYPLLCQQHMG
jgi:hypothetical protein